jgi:hypothetical protein
MFKIHAHVLLATIACVALAGNLWADAQAAEKKPEPESNATAPKGDVRNERAGVEVTRLKGRATDASRAACVKKYGGKPAGEAAVAAALKWLASHQLPDGGWNFDHRLGPDPDIRMSDHAGNLTGARNAATAMAVLPFLGAGQTHTEGHYRETVKGGLSYLMTHMKENGSMHEGGGCMYSHGLGSITLCEALAMTGDKKLETPAQTSLEFINYAQDPVGGGWRYQPRQAGDTSVTGWQLIALQTGHMAYLQVNPNTIRGATKFLDSVQTDNGAFYGYTTPSKRGTTTAVGLLCRMYLGWSRDNLALRDGVKYLSAEGPSSTNMYYNYYATQVMHQYGGKYWRRWNRQMRDFLVNSQDKQGAAKGSWHFDGGYGAARGGRIYNTSLATMILEVYYRHMPIDEKKVLSEQPPR